MFLPTFLRSFLVIILFACLLFVTACGGKKEPPKTKPVETTTVDAIVAQPIAVSSIVEANGTVIANETVELHPEVTGRLTYLNIPEGKYVQQGTVLARVNDADLRAQVVKSNVQLQLAEQNQQRLSKLLDIQGVNQADYDAIVNQVGSLKADIQYTQALIEKTVIRAPFSGTLGLRQVSPGAYVSSATVIATLQQTTRTKIDFTLPEQFSNLVKTGNTVNVSLDANDSAKSQATIIAVEPQINQTTRNLKVRALLQEGKSNPGGFVKVYVNSGTDKKAILVPTNSIIPGDKSNQLILVKGGKAIFTDVKTGTRQASNVEVTDGVAVGDTVVVTGVLFARPNSIVKVRSVKKLAELE